MAAQLGHLYSANKIAARPVHQVIHTSFSPDASPRLHAKMVHANCLQWSRSIWYPGGLNNLSDSMKSTTTGDEPSPSPLPALAGKTLIYLSADATEELTTLSEDEVYVIGGLVDRNRHKVSQH